MSTSTNTDSQYEIPTSTSGSRSTFPIGTLKLKGLNIHTSPSFAMRPHVSHKRGVGGGGHVHDISTIRGLQLTTILV